jgi:hypothetical protein
LVDGVADRDFVDGEGYAGVVEEEVSGLDVAKERLIELDGALFPEVVVDYEPGGAENVDELENGFVEALRLRMELELGGG